MMQMGCISPMQMEHMVEHGDILLFHSDNINSKVQRFVTNSEFDHVAILVRLEDGKAAVLEATGGSGVEINLWEDFIRRGWVDIFVRMCYRKLSCRRDTAFNISLSNFINENVGKKYEITVEKLFKLNSLIPDFLKGSPTQEEKAKKEYETFFCSELVAACYKACGIITHSKACSQYWPVTFTDKSFIPFLNGAKLEAQLEINTDM